MAVISRPKGAEVVVMNERYRADGADGYFDTPRGAEWAKHPGNPRFPHAPVPGGGTVRDAALKR
jgi:hypothetical protein